MNHMMSPVSYGKSTPLKMNGGYQHASGTRGTTEATVTNYEKQSILREAGRLMATTSPYSGAPLRQRGNSPFKSPEPFSLG
jgi:hypothetical protein